MTYRCRNHQWARDDQHTRQCVRCKSRAPVDAEGEER